MMAIKERNFSPLKDLSLEELVPEGNFYRRLERTVDLSFVRELVGDRYASGGRPSVDPVVFFKLQLVLFFEDLRSERQLMEVVADRLSIRWYLGYDLDEPLPDHSSLTRIRERYGLEVFRCFFEEIVQLCIEAGLVWGKELFFDSTKVEANADVDSLRSRSIAENHLKELFEETAAPQKKIEDFATTPHPSSDASAADALPTAGEEALEEDNARSKDWISRDGRQDRTFSSGARQRTADRLVSTTDPDATPMRVSGSETKLGYQVHYVVDGGKARVILNALVTPSEVSENRPMLDLLWRSAFRWHLWPDHVTGDAKYGTAENVRAIESAGIRAYVAPHESGGKGEAFFGKGEFVYDPKRDVYMCPRGEPLRLEAHDRATRRKRRYRAKAEACDACPLKPKCTTNKLGRIVMRNFDEEYLDRVRAYQETEPYRKALRKRQVWIESLFAEAKDWHGMRRFRLRRLKKVNIEALLIVSGQNVKRLLAFGGRRPKKPAQAAALRLPEARLFYWGCHARRCHRSVLRTRRRRFSTSC
ncbi:MAG: IS1182 family transposase [Actinobacteria bacterium]|nr:IS1182 family transposase [Actinomycetota bacterium]